MGRIVKSVSALILLLALSLAAAELFHRVRFGHFFRSGLHMDIVLGGSDVGSKDTYYARVWNLSLWPFFMQGCRLPGGFAGEGILYKWDVQKWDQADRIWKSLRGADTWVAKPFGSYSNDEGCQTELVHIRPFSSQVVGWVYKDWVTTGEPVRMAIHTLVTTPPENQQILYTDTFVMPKGPK